MLLITLQLRRIQNMNSINFDIEFKTNEYCSFHASFLNTEILGYREQIRRVQNANSDQNEIKNWIVLKLYSKSELKMYLYPSD